VLGLQRSVPLLRLSLVHVPAVPATMSVPSGLAASPADTTR
jgi:hypothetical protein